LVQQRARIHFAPFLVGYTQVMKSVRAGLTAGAMVILLAACGGPAPSPLQSPVQPSPPAPPTAAPNQPNQPAQIATLASTVTPVPSPTGALVPTAAPRTPVAQPQQPQQPTVPPTPTITPLPALVPTVVRTPLTLPTPVGGVPDTRATSQAVILTITALAIPPTMPPTATPQRAIGAGGRGRVTAIPTPTLDPSGISILSLPEKAYRGGAGSLTIRTRPNATCTVQMAAAGETKPLPGGASRVAGGDGVAAWIWTVDANEAAGVKTLQIDCGDAGKTAATITVE
jgi:hypothetical protein